MTRHDLPRPARTALASIAILLLLPALAACGDDDPAPSSDSSAASADAGASDADGATTTGADDVPGASDALVVSAADDRSGLPDGFPDDVPIPKGTLQKADATGGSAYLLEVLVTAPPANAPNGYRDLLVAAGWDVDPSSVEGNIVLTRGAGRSVVIGSYPEGEGTVLQIAVEGAI